ncbi:hypothetical protein V7S43_014029 [Phytophthora oleae]|uniref:D-isomer specific 2-hydroxyacid dehydrogenase NAD-binding domain-containing protein n=1 Tax=Phytophthora oleae TaxID=2107226 RepID=A0ABD3F2S1_9STRA
MPALRVPIVSFIRGVGGLFVACGQALPVRGLAIRGYSASPTSRQQTGGWVKDFVAEPRWDLNPEQHQIVEQAEVLVMDSHTGGALFLDPDTNLPSEKRHILDNVKWVQGTYAGVEMYLLLLKDEQQLPKFKLTRGGGVMPKIMAQYVFGYVTLIERMLLEAKEFQNKREFARMELLLWGSLGWDSQTNLGDIGQGVGTMLRTAGYNVVGFKRHANPQEVANLSFCGDRITTALDDVLANSDYIVSVLPSTNATRYLLTEKNLQQCRERSPVFINIGRGNVISEKTLLDALDARILLRAVLDVFEQEPLPRVSALWSHPSVHLTPHVSLKTLDLCCSLTLTTTSVVNR